MKYLINEISVISAFGFATGIIYLILDCTIGGINIIKAKSEHFGFQIKEITFLIIAILLATKLKFIRPFY